MLKARKLADIENMKKSNQKLKAISNGDNG
jgi:hypothetical protein